MSVPAFTLIVDDVFEFDDALTVIVGHLASELAVWRRAKQSYL